MTCLPTVRTHPILGVAFNATIIVLNPTSHISPYTPHLILPKTLFMTIHTNPPTQKHPLLKLKSLRQLSTHMGSNQLNPSSEYLSLHQLPMMNTVMDMLIYSPFSHLFKSLLLFSPTICLDYIYFGNHSPLSPFTSNTFPKFLIWQVMSKVLFRA